MPTTYRATLTEVGAALVADAIASGTTLTWAKMALGDGNGSAVVVDAGRTSLVNERYRAPLNDLGRDSANPNTIVGTLVVPPETGGWTIREFGIYDNASTPRLVAYGETPEIEKPASSAGTGVNLRLRFKLVVSADANITLSPDSNEAYATIEYVKDNAVKSLSVSGRTITYTMGDGDTHTIRTQDTTYGIATQDTDGLLARTDKIILDNIPNDYYPKSGGQITGSHVCRDVTNNYLWLGGGTSYQNGAHIYLNGKDSDSGSVKIFAHDGTTNKCLYLKANGSITWNNNKVLTIADLATQNAAGAMSAADKTRLDTKLAPIPTNSGIGQFIGVNVEDSYTLPLGGSWVYCLLVQAKNQTAINISNGIGPGFASGGYTFNYYGYRIRGFVYRYA